MSRRSVASRSRSECRSPLVRSLASVITVDVTVLLDPYAGGGPVGSPEAIQVLPTRPPPVTSGMYLMYRGHERGGRLSHVYFVS